MLDGAKGGTLLAAGVLMLERAVLPARPHPRARGWAKPAAAVVLVATGVLLLPRRQMIACSFGHGSRLAYAAKSTEPPNLVGMARVLEELHGDVHVLTVTLAPDLAWLPEQVARLILASPRDDGARVLDDEPAFRIVQLRAGDRVVGLNGRLPDKARWRPGERELVVELRRGGDFVVLDIVAGARGGVEPSRRFSGRRF
jgi:hypothetical protein